MSNQVAKGFVTFLKWAVLPAALFLAYELGKMVNEDGTDLWSAIKDSAGNLMPSESKAQPTGNNGASGSDGAAASRPSGNQQSSQQGPPTKSPLTLNYYTVQVGKFKDREEARILRSELMARRINHSVCLLYTSPSPRDPE